MKHKILVVDDERDVLLVVQTSLQQAGYNVVTANHGQDGIEQAKTQQPDLILMDVAMPQMDGFEATRILKSDAATAAIPIVMLTASGQYSDMEQGWEAGIDLYLEKPFRNQQLVEYIRSILEDED